MLRNIIYLGGEIVGLITSAMSMQNKGGKSSILKPLQVTKNGLYLPKDYECDGFSEVNVNIPNDLMSRIDSARIDYGISFANGYYLYFSIDDIEAVMPSRRMAVSSERDSQNNPISFISLDAVYPVLYIKAYYQGQLLYARAYNNPTGIIGEQKMWSYDPSVGVYLSTHSTTILQNREFSVSMSYRSDLPRLQFSITYEVTYYYYNTDGECYNIDNPSKSVFTGNSSFYFDASGNSILFTNLNAKEFVQAEYNLRMACADSLGL